MAAIEIRDLEVRKELDQKAMAMIVGGAFKSLSVPAGWTIASAQTERMNAGLIMAPSNDIKGAFEFKTKFQDITTVTLRYSEFVAG